LKGTRRFRVQCSRGKPSKKQPERYIAQARTLLRGFSQFVTRNFQTLSYYIKRFYLAVTRRTVDQPKLITTWATNSRLASQESPNIICSPDVHYRVHKSPPPSLSWAHQSTPYPPPLNPLRFFLIRPFVTSHQASRNSCQEQGVAGG
jgi:hypothetical protein